MGAEQILNQQLVAALAEGDFKKFIGYAVIFFVLWLEVRGLKKQLEALNKTISNSFEKGEKRFETIEKDIHQIRLDVDNFKNNNPIGGLKHGEQSI